jgi:TrmH family RNA methyltransferase
MLCGVTAAREIIRSSAHPLLKRVRAAAHGRARGEMLLEGDRLVDEALRLGLTPEVVLVDEGRSERIAELERAGRSVRAVRAELLASASALQNAPGCLALVPEPRTLALDELPAQADELLVVAAGIQDPGNLGALARTAEAAGATALLVTAGGCSPWNPKVVRGSMGSILRLPIAVIEPGETPVRALAARGYRHVSARTRGGTPLARFTWAGRIALWLSSEVGGFPPELERASERFEGVTIPMHGAVESLNVTAAAAVLLFAAGRAGGGR